MNNRPSSEFDLNVLKYNYVHCGGTSSEFEYELSLGEILDFIITHVNINYKGNKNKNHNDKKRNSESFHYGRVD